jgi:murein DD-endopeptidase MepM/ murein hydrolase activator NlpD
MMAAMKRLLLLGLLLTTLAPLRAAVAQGPAGGPGASVPPVLQLPLACDAGKGCVVQHYVDHDPGPGTRDFRCGHRTYDGHDGIDIRIPVLTPTPDGVAVLAPAAGRIIGQRDGVADINVRKLPPGGLNGHDCGKGVLIDLGGGWQVQLCHMKKGSLRVGRGTMVQPGQALGLVGESGNAEFPHLHITVRQDGKAIDPLAYGAAPGACSSGRSLFTPQATAALGYRRGEVINAGFAGAPVEIDAIDHGDIAKATRQTPLLAYAVAIALEAGDVQHLQMFDPAGKSLADNLAPPLARDSDQRLLYAGARPPAGGWPAGRYRAQYRVLRAGKAVVERRFELQL